MERLTISLIRNQRLGIAVGIVVGVALTLGALAGVVALGGGGDSKTGATARPAPRRHVIYTLRPGDSVRDPLTSTRCDTSAEAGIPNLFCTRNYRGRYQIVFYEDSVEVFDLQDPNREPLAATYSFKWKTRKSSPK